MYPCSTPPRPPPTRPSEPPSASHRRPPASSCGGRPGRCARPRSRRRCPPACTCTSAALPGHTGGGAYQSLRERQTLRSLCAACFRASALTLGRVNSGADAGLVSLPWDNRGVTKRRGRPAGARTRTSAILASMVLYSSGLAATLALRSAANLGCAHERARNHHTLWNQSTASRHGRPHFGAHRGARALGGLCCAEGWRVHGGREVSG